MSKIKLSIMMPCYNCQHTVKESIDSIYDQNISFPFEIIMIDDGSTDNTYQEIEKLAKKHKEIKVFQNNKNRGEGYTRNKAISLSSGEIIGYLDSDNLFGKDCIKHILTYIDENNLDGAHLGAFRRFSNNIKNYKTVTFNPKYLSLQTSLLESRIEFEHFFLKKTAYTELRYGEGHGLGNVDIALKLLASDLKLGVSENSYIYHRFFDKNKKSLYEETHESGLIGIHQYCCFEQLFYLLSKNSLSKIIQADIKTTSFSKEFYSIIQTQNDPILEKKTYKNWKDYMDKNPDAEDAETLFLHSIYTYKEKKFEASLSYCINLCKKQLLTPIVLFNIQRNLLALSNINHERDITEIAYLRSISSEAIKAQTLRSPLIKKIGEKLRQLFTFK